MNIVMGELTNPTVKKEAAWLPYNKRMSNQSLRDRFRLNKSKSGTVSQIIGATKEAGLIKSDESESNSTRYARYLPFWA